MSNIYIQEPPTSGKVLLTTTVGDIDIELWSKETPKACRNFVQLCLEKYYNGTIFHRVIPEFIAQGGDPNGDGTGGESIYGGAFKDEFHSRLRFVRRGLVAMANAGKDDNGSQFFFTLGPCNELQNKHTIFGKVTGDTLYNMLKLQDCDTDENDRPVYPHKILHVKVLLNPFSDITPRLKVVDLKDESISIPKKKMAKNFALLSFGDEAEEEQNEVDSIAETFRGKGKSSHDLANDPNLSSVSAKSLYEDGDNKSDSVETIRKKFKESSVVPLKKDKIVEVHEVSESTTVDMESVKDQIKKLKKDLRKQKANADSEINKSDLLDKEKEKPDDSNPLLSYFHQESEKYGEKRKIIPQDKAEREKQTLAILSKFQTKLKNTNDDTENNQKKVDDDDDLLAHKFECDYTVKHAKDANVTEEDRYDITDPRNPITKRRRMESKKKSHRK